MMKDLLKEMYEKQYDLHHRHPEQQEQRFPVAKNVVKLLPYKD